MQSFEGKVPNCVDGFIGDLWSAQAEHFDVAEMLQPGNGLIVAFIEVEQDLFGMLP
jgi:hypothetical protein